MTTMRRIRPFSPRGAARATAFRRPRKRSGPQRAPGPRGCSPQADAEAVAMLYQLMCEFCRAGTARPVSSTSGQGVALGRPWGLRTCAEQAVPWRRAAPDPDWPASTAGLGARACWKVSGHGVRRGVEELQKLRVRVASGIERGRRDRLVTRLRGRLPRPREKGAPRPVRRRATGAGRAATPPDLPWTRPPCKGALNIKDLGKLRYVVEQSPYSSSSSASPCAGNDALNSTTPSFRWPAATSAGGASRRPDRDRVTSSTELRATSSW